MRKGKLFITMLSAAILFPSTVLAADTNVGTSNDLRTCVGVANSVCKLSSNITLDSVIETSSNVTIDLNGKTITSGAGYSDDSLITVLRGSTLTINDSSTNKLGAIDADEVAVAVKITKLGENDATTAANLVVNGGTLNASSFAISGNGYRHNTNITINGGTFTGKNGTAIYHPQDGKLTINGGTFTGADSGIEMRAGNLVVNGGTIIGNGVPSSDKPNGSGTTTIGAGIAVAQHTTKLVTTAEINGGTIKAYTPIYQSDPQNNIENDANNIDKVSLTITGGTFNIINGGQAGTVYSENKTNFITGGTFSTDVTSFVKTGYECVKSGDNFVVSEISDEVSIPVVDVNSSTGDVKEATVGVVGETSKIEEILLKSWESINLTVEDKVEVALEIATLDIAKIEKDLLKEMEKVAGKAKIDSFFDITVAVKKFEDGSLLGNVSTLTEEIELMILLPEELKNTNKDIDRTYYVIRNHDGKIEKLATELSEDGKYLVFKTDKFSTYALAYEDVEVKEELPPKTFDSISVYFIIALVSIAGLFGIKNIANKKKIFG